MKDKIDTQTRKDPGASFFFWRRGPVLSARVAEERSRVSGRELAGEDERTRADPARRAKGGGLGLWKQFKVFSSSKMGAQPKDVGDTRRVPTWTEVGGARTVEARYVATGYQDPDLRNSKADIAGCARKRSYHSQIRAIWSLDTKNASHQADGFDREVYVRAPCGRDSEYIRRVSILRAPAYGPRDAPMASRRPPRK